MIHRLCNPWHISNSGEKWQKNFVQLFIEATRTKCRVYLITEDSGNRYQAAGVRQL